MSKLGETDHVATEGASSKRNRAIFAGLALGIVLFLVALSCIQIVLPSQSMVDQKKDYGYIYSGAKSESLDFVDAASAENTVLLFGSSELSTPSSVIPQVPAEVFGMNDYGLDLMYIGEAYDQSLWQAIAAGAYGSQVKNKKVILIVSPTWFEDDGLDNETFKLNDQILSAIADLQIRKDLIDVRERAFDRVFAEAASQVTPLDFDALYEAALADAQAACTTNDWGMDDAFYQGSIEGKLDRLKGTQTDESFQNQTEYQDFSFFLKVCKEAGLEPLVIISPVHGEFYDWVGTSQTDRQRCYDRIKEICAAHNVACEDYSDKEYETYFLHDIVHFGWTGWVAVEEAIYNYAKAQ